MRSAIRWVVVGVLTISLVAVAGCASEPAGKAEAVAITKDGYDPADLVVKKGTTVVWTNKDTTPHSVSSIGSVFDSGIMQPGAKFSHTFDKAGSYLYNCSVEASLSAEVLVKR